MRGSVPGLLTPHPFGPALPGLYQEDDFAMRFVAGFDDVLAPVHLTLDNLDAYVSPDLAPPDFLDLVAAWLGMPVDPQRPLPERRAQLRRYVTGYHLLGTVRGLAEIVAAATGARVEVADSGGTAVSRQPNGAVPGEPEPWVRVTVHAATNPAIDAAKLDDLVAAVTPAHVRHEVQVVAA